MKKRVLSMLMTLALCLTLLPTPAWAAEDAPEGGAIVQQEQQEEISPAVSEQAGTNEEENGSEVTRRIPVPLTPVALRTAKQMRPRSARMKTPGTMRTRRYPLCRR